MAAVTINLLVSCFSGVHVFPTNRSHDKKAPEISSRPCNDVIVGRRAESVSEHEFPSLSSR